jgi:hypothetical protein
MATDQANTYDTIEQWVSLFKAADSADRPAITQSWLEKFADKQSSARAHVNMLHHTPIIREMVCAIPPGKDVKKRTQRWLANYLPQSVTALRGHIENLHDLWLHPDLDRRITILSEMAKDPMGKIPDNMGVHGSDWLRAVIWDVAADAGMTAGVIDDIMELMFISEMYPWEYRPGTAPLHPMSDLVGILLTRCRQGNAKLAGCMSTDVVKTALIQSPRLTASFLRRVEKARMNSDPLYGRRVSDASKLRQLPTWFPEHKNLFKTAGALGLSFDETMVHVCGYLMEGSTVEQSVDLPAELVVAG